MVEITKSQAEYLRSHGVAVTRTCKLKQNGKKRGKMYAAEEPYILKLLNEYNSQQIIATTYGEV